MTEPKQRIRGLRLPGGALILVLACAASLAAAPAPKKAAAKPQPQADVFGGYSFVHAGEANLNGWQLSGSYPAWRSLSLVVDLSGHYGGFAGADLSQVELLVGARHYWRWNRFRPFAELLVGGVRHEASFATADGDISSSGTDFAFSPGFGADYRVTRAWSARAAFDLLLVHGGGWEARPEAVGRRGLSLRRALIL